MARTKKVNPNRPIERAVVNAAQTFFDSHNIPFMTVESDVDFGKDAFIELIQEDEPTGRLIAFQFKGGEQTCRTRAGSLYRGIPYSEQDARHFRRSNVPVLGMTTAPGPRGSGTVLQWVNLTEHCAQRFDDDARDRGGFADISSTLDDYRLAAFLEQMTLLASRRVESVALDLARYDDGELQAAAIQDCFALGLRDPRPLILVRKLLFTLREDALFVAISALAHVVGHGDIFYGPRNTVSSDVRRRVSPHLRWSLPELAQLLEVLSEEDEDQMWGRGVFGEHIIALIMNDRNSSINLIRVAESRKEYSELARLRAFVLALYLADEDSVGHVQSRILRYSHDLAEHPMVHEVIATVREHGQLDIF